ncbi:MAG: NAD-binding protein [Candidatus Helarchaeota archaeon]
MKKQVIKAKLLLRQNSLALSIIIFWFVLNFIIVYIITGDYLEALAVIFYFYILPGPYGIFYPMISEFIIFGIIFAVIITDFYRKYSPKQTSLELAKSTENHVIIIGYSNLGKKIRAYLTKIKKECVVIEEDENLIKELLDKEFPVITREPHDIEVLKNANVQKAELVITTKNDLETLIVATGYI